MNPSRLFALACLLAPIAFAQTPYSLTTVTAYDVQNSSAGAASGTAPLATGELCFIPSVQPVTPLGGAPASVNFCGNISGGGLTATLQIPNTSTASPAGMTYTIQVLDMTGTVPVTVLWIPGIAISTTTFAFDSFVIPAYVHNANGADQPYYSCQAGAMYTQNDAVAGNNIWTCATVGGATGWHLQWVNPNYAEIQARHIIDASGHFLNNGLITFSPVDNAGNPISYFTNPLGQAVLRPVSTTVNSGYFDITVAATDQTSPMHVCYAVTIVDNATGAQLLGPGYSCVQPETAQYWCTSAGAGEGLHCGFDTYRPIMAGLNLLNTSTPGPTGAAATIAIGTVATGSTASIYNVGTDQAAIWNVTLPASGSVSGATTPATSNLLKGNGAANGVVAAVPNVDYQPPIIANTYDAYGAATAAIAALTASQIPTLTSAKISNFVSAASAAAPVQSVNGSTGAVIVAVPIPGTGSSNYAVGNDSRITGAEQAANKGAASGYAPLNSSSQVPLGNLPTIPNTQVSGLPVAGTGGSNYAAGNDSRITGALQKSTVPASQPCLGSDSGGNPIAGTCSGGVATVNGQTGAAVVGLVDSSLVYVGPSGSDANDGKTPQTAKATAYGAQQILPVNGTHGSGGYEYGTVVFLARTHTAETHTLEWNAQQRWICLAGTGMDSVNSGCTVGLANGQNIALLSYTSDFATANGYSHWLEMDHMTIDCNGANNTGTSDCVAQLGGGFSNVYRYTFFKNANGFGTTIERQAINVSFEHCNWADDKGGAIHIHDTAGLNHITVSDTQIDRSGTSPILIESTTASSQEDFVNFIGLKVESHTTGNTDYSGTSGSHVHVIDYRPRTSSGGNSMTIKIDGGWAANTNGVGTSAFYEENNAGVGARWLINGYTATGYTSGFTSAKTGQASQQVFMANASFGDTTSYTHAPSFEGVDIVLSGLPSAPCLSTNVSGQIIATTCPGGTTTYTNTSTGGQSRPLTGAYSKPSDAMSVLDFIPQSSMASLAAGTVTSGPDMTTYLQAAITAAEAAGKSLFLPGPYFYHTTNHLCITSGFGLVGESHAQVVPTSGALVNDTTTKSTLLNCTPTTDYLVDLTVRDVFFVNGLNDIDTAFWHNQHVTGNTFDSPVNSGWTCAHCERGEVSHNVSSQRYRNTVAVYAPGRPTLSENASSFSTPYLAFVDRMNFDNNIALEGGAGTAYTIGSMILGPPNDGTTYQAASTVSGAVISNNVIFGQQNGMCSVGCYVFGQLVGSNAGPFAIDGIGTAGTKSPNVFYVGNVLRDVVITGLNPGYAGSNNYTNGLNLRNDVVNAVCIACDLGGDNSTYVGLRMAGTQTNNFTLVSSTTSYLNESTNPQWRDHMNAVGSNINPTNGSGSVVFQDVTNHDVTASLMADTDGAAASHSYLTAKGSVGSGVVDIFFQAGNDGTNVNRSLTMQNGHTFTAGSVAFASLPSSSNGTILYCSDCKNIADDAATFDSTAVASGHGTTVLRENGVWRVH